MRFVLVHGAWHFGDLWDGVRSHLVAAGHEVHTPTAGGLRPGDGMDVDLRGAAEPIARYIRDRKLSDYVLVGHSWGGYLVTRLAIDMPERLRRLVYFAAYVPAHGRALIDELPPALAEAVAELVAPDGSLQIPFAMWRDAFFSDGTADHARDVYERLRPHPFRTLTDKADMTGWDAVPKAFSFIQPYEDHDIPQGEWARHPRLTSRLGLFRLVGMPGSHEVLLTNPALTATKLVEAGRD
ncbi:alpha/beta fold hydrolase [Acuticoccus sediminis]|uniref:alpha/beta fold hydrolase n=1 Tax=Acuticoccus sediminis TaxID=2184697 RepID=UPI001CFCB26B|nr:alpha/beta hydrolase [Acuticoccus sediminis]